ncbi:MAG: hypothetical protein CBC83_00545 [Flavobacteriales bacterium TMED123]|nr:MAG: hypothetical protein CBC83_00545 [Flavobacteriales bacterium TMED123]
MSMLNYEALGTVPVEEPCVQYNTPDYFDKVHEEIKRFKEFCEKVFPEAQKFGCQFYKKRFPYEEEAYYELAINFDDSCLEACEYSTWVMDNIPMLWEETEPKKFNSEYGVYCNA